MPVVDVNGTKINYTQLAYKGEGEAEDLIMVHGLASNMAFWLGEYANTFASRFRVTLFDMRGHGRSKVAEKGYSPDNLCEDLKGLMNELSIDKAHLVSHSFGGVIALNLAYKYPESVQSVVLADTQINMGRHLVKSKGVSSANNIQQILQDNGIEIDSKHPYFGYYFMTEMAKLKTSNISLSAELDGIVQKVFEGSSIRAAQKWLDLMDNTTAFEELTGDDNLSVENIEKVKCPILGVYAQNTNTMATADCLIPTLPEDDFVLVEGVGHFFPKVSQKMLIELCNTFLGKESLDSVVNNYECLKYISRFEGERQKVFA